MIATVANAALIVIGSLLGLLLKNRMTERLSGAIFSGLGVCVAVIGISGAIGTQDMLCVIICIVFGIIIGEALNIEKRLDVMGDKLKAAIIKNGEVGRFTEGFVTSTLLFCVGSMAIVGSIEAGINKDYSIILSKGVIDCFAAITFSATMGIGVIFSAVMVFLYQGALTLLAVWIGPLLSEAVICEMSAVGGLLIMGLSVNMLELRGKKRLRIGNMLPAVILPIAYLPISDALSAWLSKIF